MAAPSPSWRGTAVMPAARPPSALRPSDAGLFPQTTRQDVETRRPPEPQRLTLEEAIRYDEERVARRFEYLDDILAAAPRNARYEREVEWAIHEYSTSHEPAGIAVRDIACGPAFCRVQYTHETPDAIQQLIVDEVRTPIFGKQGVQLRTEEGGAFTTTHFLITGDERLPDF